MWMLVWVFLYVLICRRYNEVFSWWALLLPASASFAMAVSGFNMHIAFGCMMSLFLLMWRVWEIRPDDAFARFGTLFLLALTMSCVEYSLFLLAFGGLWLMWQLFKSTTRQRFLREHLANTGFVVLCMSVFWFGGVAGLGLAKSYAYTAYIGLFRFTPSPFTDRKSVV